MGGPILYFFLLVLEIPFNLSLDVGYKQSRFFKTLSKKCFELVLSKVNNTIILKLGLVLLLVKVDPILKKQGHKKDVLIAHDTGRVKIVFV